MGSIRHALFSTRFGSLALVWEEREEAPLIQRVFLSADDVSGKDPAVLRRVIEGFPGARAGRDIRITDLGARMMRFLEGVDAFFGLDDVALNRCPAFQQAVLKAEYGIARGQVATYAGIAKHLGVPGGARAVGGALARNPFPLIIPCHRAIRSDGTLGGYQGGPEMKRALLDQEGVQFAEDGRVISPRFFY
jgi:methylated-DNA-[protein]-cysteine S-methyltransferase